MHCALDTAGSGSRQAGVGKAWTAPPAAGACAYNMRCILRACMLGADPCGAMACVCVCVWQIKAARGGATRVEARLDSKRHRATSRRAAKQGLMAELAEQQEEGQLQL